MHLHTFASHTLCKETACVGHWMGYVIKESLWNSPYAKQHSIFMHLTNTFAYHKLCNNKPAVRGLCTERTFMEYPLLKPNNIVFLFDTTWMFQNLACRPKRKKCPRKKKTVEVTCKAHIVSFDPAWLLAWPPGRKKTSFAMKRVAQDLSSGI